MGRGGKGAGKAGDMPVMAAATSQLPSGLKDTAYAPAAGSALAGSGVPWPAALASPPVLSAAGTMSELRAMSCRHAARPCLVSPYLYSRSSHQK